MGYLLRTEVPKVSPYSQDLTFKGHGVHTDLISQVMMHGAKICALGFNVDQTTSPFHLIQTIMIGKAFRVLNILLIPIYPKLLPKRYLSERLLSIPRFLYRSSLSNLSQHQAVRSSIFLQITRRGINQAIPPVRFSCLSFFHLVPSPKTVAIPVAAIAMANTTLRPSM